MRSLLDKYLDGTITEKERQALSAMLDDPSYAKELEAIITNELHQHTFEGKADATILTSILENLNEHTKPKRSFKFLSIKKLAIAASVITVVALGGFYLSRNKLDKTPIVTSQVKSNFSTMLSLSNGVSLNLDTMSVGNTLYAKGIEITKIDSETIAYKTIGNINKSSSSLNTLATSKKRQAAILLADGSKIWLNASSQLQFPTNFASNRRDVYMSGEGYFEIAKNPAKPFHVTVNTADIKVLGTHFNVNSYSKKANFTTSLLEGKVEIASLGKVVVLLPGKQANVNGSNIVVKEFAEKDVLAWKHKLFRFEDASLTQILEEVARWYEVEFVFEKEINDTFSGEIARNVEINKLLNILELTGKVHFDINGKTITVK